MGGGAIPVELQWSIVLTAFQTYRIMFAPLLPLVGKDGELPSGWMSTASQETFIGLLSPFVCYFCAHAPSYRVWALTVAYHAVGIISYAGAYLANVYLPAHAAKPLAALPRRSAIVTRVAVPSWLAVNFILQAIAFCLVLQDHVPEYMNHEFLMGSTFHISEGPLGGYWILICVAGYAMMGAVFYFVTPKRSGGKTKVAAPFGGGRAGMY